MYYTLKNRQCAISKATVADKRVSNVIARKAFAWRGELQAEKGVAALCNPAHNDRLFGLIQLATPKAIILEQGGH